MRRWTIETKPNGDVIIGRCVELGKKRKWSKSARQGSHEKKTYSGRRISPGRLGYVIVGSLAKVTLRSQLDNETVIQGTIVKQLPPRFLQRRQARHVHMRDPLNDLVVARIKDCLALRCTLPHALGLADRPGRMVRRFLGQGRIAV